MTLAGGQWRFEETWRLSENDIVCFPVYILKCVIWVCYSLWHVRSNKEFVLYKWWTLSKSLSTCFEVLYECARIFFLSINFQVYALLTLKNHENEWKVKSLVKSEDELFVICIVLQFVVHMWTNISFCFIYFLVMLFLNGVREPVSSQTAEICSTNKPWWSRRSWGKTVFQTCCTVWK